LLRAFALEYTLRMLHRQRGLETTLSPNSRKPSIAEGFRVEQADYDDLLGMILLNLPFVKIPLAPPAENQDKALSFGRSEALVKTRCGKSRWDVGNPGNGDTDTLTPWFKPLA